MMRKLYLAFLLSLLFSGMAFAGPRLVVTGVTSYTPEKAWNGFTILSGDRSGKLIDMNGNLVHEWDLKGGMAFPGKVYPGGYFLGNINPQYKEAGQGQSMVALMDFNGKVRRSFNRLDKIKKDPGSALPKEADGSTWISRSHHDYQIEGSSAGYYAPNTKVNFDGKMLILAHNTSVVSKIANYVQLQDDRIIVIDKNGKIIFDWKAADHVDEFKNLLDHPDAKFRLNNAMPELGTVPAGLEYNGFDWFHINCASWLGPNKWYDAGDKRFHPDNIIADSRETSHMFIIDHKTGKVVWQVAPPFTGEDADIGAVYGVHHTHMIPKGLPGEGNILIYDNGGTTSYHKELPPRYYSRVVEYDPVTKKKVWEYSIRTAAKMPWQLYGDKFFFSAHISSAQRLPNGNTMITEGSACRIFEVTPDYEIVWEYISPYNYDDPGRYVYRAYRMPYDWVPQLPKGSEVPVTLPKSAAIQIPNDKGDYANVAPKVDTHVAPRFNPMMPVSAPGARKAPAASVVTEPDGDDDQPPMMKAY